MPNHWKRSQNCLERNEETVRNDDYLYEMGSL